MRLERHPSEMYDPRHTAIRAGLNGRSIVLVGLMGAGKTTVGRRLAARLGLPFIDVDAEIEHVSQMTVPEIFARHGEPYFRDGEKRVIDRLLRQGEQVLATGGGAFMNADTRRRIAESGISVWLKADLDVLLRRVKKRAGRPLLETADPQATLRRLMDERYPVYAQADITTVSHEAPHDTVVNDIICALVARLLPAGEAT
jgi:shikimate kinase